MKSLRIVLMGLIVFGVVIFLSNVLFAEEGCPAMKTNHESRIKLLKDSAAALQQANPDLAKGLSDLADKEAKETQEWKTQRDAKVKLLNDSAAALQQSNPDLAKGLQGICANKSKATMNKMMQEKNEKEEAAEKIEPKGDK
jgi:regulatory protein YycI of two-component signal transduction system YycFG